MVRTKNTAARIGSKAPRKGISTPALDLKGRSVADLFKSKSSGGDTGNPYCPRETPSWQKEITKFFPRVPSSASSSSQQDVDPVSASEDCETSGSNGSSSQDADPVSASEDCESNDAKNG